MWYIHYGILLSHKKKWSTAVCANMDGPWEYHAKWTKTENVKNSYVGHKAESYKLTNKKNKPAKTHRHRQQYVCYRGQGASEG